MATEAYLIAVLSAAIWSLSMVGLKLGLEEGGTSLQASLVVAFTDVAVYWGLLLVLGQVGVFADVSLVGLGAFVLAGVIGTALGRFASFSGIHRVGASVNSAGISTRPLFATALAFVLIDEAVSPQVVGGILLLVGGLVVLSLSRGGDIGGWQAYELLFPLSAAGAFALSDVLRRWGLTTTAATPLHGVALNETAGGLLLAAYVLTRRRDAMDAVSRRTYAIFVGSGVLNALSLLMFFVSLDLGRVAIASSLIATTPLFTAAFAYFLLDDLERITRGVVAGAALVVVGAVVITLA
ncbi:EamA family transporter [Salinirubellus sp. GCM10025818]|uniref:DMT family transporter n=1 Tax=Salinirubellus TaxID=2162630 RepID=UPI0030D1C258